MSWIRHYVSLAPRVTLWSRVVDAEGRGLIVRAEGESAVFLLLSFGLFLSPSLKVPSLAPSSQKNSLISLFSRLSLSGLVLSAANPHHKPHPLLPHPSLFTPRLRDLSILSAGK